MGKTSYMVKIVGLKDSKKVTKETIIDKKVYTRDMPLLMDILNNVKKNTMKNLSNWGSDVIFNDDHTATLRVIRNDYPQYDNEEGWKVIGTYIPECSHIESFNLYKMTDLEEITF